MLSVVIEAFKKSVMFLCTPFANRCLVYSHWALYHLALLISQTRRDSPCAYRKIPKISPGAYIFQRPFLRGLFLEGLIFGGAYLWREVCVSKSIGLAL